MRVLLVSNLFPTDAAPIGGVFVSARIEALRSLGHEVLPVAVKLAPMGIRRATRNPVRGETFSSSHAHVGPVDLARVRRTDLAWAAASRLGRRLVNQYVDIDVVVGHGAYGVPAAGVALGFGDAAGVPAFAVFHGSDVNLHLQHRPGVAARHLSRLSGATFVSRALRDRSDDLGLFRGPVAVIPNGIDPTVFDGIVRRQTCAGRGARPTVAFVGNLQPIKGADRLPDLFEALVRAVPDVRFVVAGGGPLADDLMAKTSHLPVDWLGPVPQAGVAAVLAEAQVLILPSRSEGWPCVVMEAYASGAAVVASDVGGVSEAVGQNGSVIARGPAFIENFAAAVARELTHRRDRSAQMEVARRFTWKSLAEQEIAFWENCR